MPRQKTPYSRFRPSRISEAAWREIINSWENGLSDREAAFRASRDTGLLVSEADIKQMVAENDDISALRDFLLMDILSSAKLNIRESIKEGSVSTSKWYLERKAPEEFSSKSAVAFDKAVVEISVADKKKQMDEFMEQFEHHEADGGE